MTRRSSSLPGCRATSSCAASPADRRATAGGHDPLVGLRRTAPRGSDRPSSVSPAASAAFNPASSTTTRPRHPHAEQVLDRRRRAGHRRPGGRPAPAARATGTSTWVATGNSRIDASSRPAPDEHEEIEAPVGTPVPEQQGLGRGGRGTPTGAAPRRSGESSESRRIAAPTSDGQRRAAPRSSPSMSQKRRRSRPQPARLARARRTRRSSVVGSGVAAARRDRRDRAAVRAPSCRGSGAGSSSVVPPPRRAISRECRGPHRG